MKRYMVFAGKNYYPSCGVDDLKAIYDNEQQAVEAGERASNENDWVDVVDFMTLKTIARWDEKDKITYDNIAEPAMRRGNMVVYQLFQPLTLCDQHNAIDCHECGNAIVYRHIITISDVTKNVRSVYVSNSEYYENISSVFLFDINEQDVVATFRKFGYELKECE